MYILIDEQIIRIVDEYVDGFRFKTRGEVVSFVLRKVFLEKESGNESYKQKEETEIIEKRLKDLGYL